MEIHVDKALSVPVFIQIKNQIKQAIVEHSLRKNDPIPSVREIVKSTGVSLATVQKAFDELNREGLIYSKVGVGNFVAGLSQQSSNNVHIFLPLDSLTFFVKILNGIFAQTNIYKLETQIHSLNTLKLNWDQNTIEYLHRAVDENAAVIFIEEAFGEIRELCQKTARLVPFTTIEWKLQGANAVINDYEKATYDVMHYLVSKRGAQRILVLTGRTDQYNSIHKLAGVRSYAAKAGLVEERDLFFLDTDYDAISAYQQVKTFCRHKKVEAIFCANDYEAIGTVGALTELGLLAGKDVAVIGFGDMPDPTTNYFPLTTVSQNLEQVGARAIETLVAQRSGHAIQTIEVPTHFIERNT